MGKLQQRKIEELEKERRIQEIADDTKQQELQFEEIVKRLNSLPHK